MTGLRRDQVRGFDHSHEHTHELADIPDANVLSPPGIVAPYVGTSAPTGWLMCDGSAVSRSTYAVLFAVIGTNYGAGDGSTTFNLPALCGANPRFPLGKATSGTGSTLGGTGGLIDHVHALNTTESGAAIRMDDNTNTIRSRRKAVTSAWTYTHTAALTVTASSSTSSQVSELVGNSDTANPPYQVLNFIVRHG
jgi:microcystin-dependent protein